MTGSSGGIASAPEGSSSLAEGIVPDSSRARQVRFPRRRAGDLQGNNMARPFGSSVTGPGSNMAGFSDNNMAGPSSTNMTGPSGTDMTGRSRATW